MHDSFCIIYVNKEKVQLMKNWLKVRLNLTNKLSKIIYMFLTKYSLLIKVKVKDLLLGDYLLI